MKLSETQWQVLRRIRVMGKAFDGRQMRTLDALSRFGFVTYHARWQCRSCGIYDCAKHKSGRWRAWASITPAGVEKLKEAP